MTDIETLRAKLNLETAQVPWSSLQRFFARGETIGVAVRLSLLDVAVAFASDDSAAVDGWMRDGTVAPVTDADAARWHESDAAVWAVVVRPWVIVQEVGSPASDQPTNS